MKKVLTYLFIFSNILMSCDKQELNNSSTAVVLPDGRIEIPLNINIDNQENIVSRAIDQTEESKIENITIAIFTPDKKLVELVTKNNLPIEYNKSTIILNYYDGECNLYPMVNLTSNTIELIKNLNKGDDLQKLLDIRETSKLHLESKFLLPMYGDIINLKNGINQDTGLSIILKKNCAKITLDGSALQSKNIDITKKPYFYNFTSSTSAYYSEFTSISPEKNRRDFYQNSSNNIFTFNYIYPQKAEDISNALNIIFYETKNNAYHKIVVKYKKDNKDYFDINPNTHYTLKILDIKDKGYASSSEADNNHPSNIEYEVIVNEGAGSDIEINNGDYYMAFSNTEAKFYGIIPNQEVILTTVTLGEGIGAEGSLDLPKNKTIISMHNSIEITNNDALINAHKNVPIPIKAIITNPLENAIIEVKCGNLSKKISVSAYKYVKDSEETFIKISDATNAEITEGNDFLSLNIEQKYPTNIISSINNPQKDIYLCTPMYLGKNTLRKAVSYISRKNTLGTLKVEILQENELLSELILPTEIDETIYNREKANEDARANCYIITPPTKPITYKLSTFRADDFWLGNYDNKHGNNRIFTAYNEYNLGCTNQSNWYANINWADTPIANTITETNIWSNYYGQNRADYNIYVYRDSNDPFALYVSFLKNFESIKKGANVFVSAKQQLPFNNDMWIYHLWITNFKQGENEITLSNGNILMDRNLGAKSQGDFATPSNNINTDSYGLFYQWGRKDPFPHSSKLNTVSLPELYDKTGIMEYPFTPATDSYTKGFYNPFYYLYSYDLSQGGDGDVGTLRSIQTFRLNRWNYHKSDPAGSNINNITLYNTKGKKTIYDPCPYGYRVPYGDNWIGMNQNSSAIRVNEGGGGLIFKPNATSQPNEGTWFPAQGRYLYNNGVMDGVGHHGQYWGASCGTESTGYVLYFDKKPFITYHTRAYGYSIRCIRDN